MTEDGEGEEGKSFAMIALATSIGKHGSLDVVTDSAA